MQYSISYVHIHLLYLIKKSIVVLTQFKKNTIKFVFLHKQIIVSSFKYVLCNNPHLLQVAMDVVVSLEIGRKF